MKTKKMQFYVKDILPNNAGIVTLMPTFFPFQSFLSTFTAFERLDLKKKKRGNPIVRITNKDFSLPIGCMQHQDQSFYGLTGRKNAVTVLSYLAYFVLAFKCPMRVGFVL